MGKEIKLVPSIISEVLYRFFNCLKLSKLLYEIHFLDEIIFFSTGLQKVGLSVAFINYHNRSKPLLHTIKVSKARALIIGPGRFQ